VFLLVWVVWAARDWPFRTRLFPWAIGIPLLALALVQLGLACWKAFRRRAAPEVDADGALSRHRTLSISAWTLAFAAGFWLFGFKVGGLMLSPAFLRVQARESWKMSTLYGLAVYLFFLVGFEMALGFPLPAGVIAPALGLQSLDWYLVNPVLNLILRR